MARKLHGAALAAHRARVRRFRAKTHASYYVPPAVRHTKRGYRRRKHTARARPFGATAARLARRNVGRFVGY